MEEQVNIPVQVYFRPSKSGGKPLLLYFPFGEDLVWQLTERGANKGGTHLVRSSPLLNLGTSSKFMSM